MINGWLSVFHEGVSQWGLDGDSKSLNTAHPQHHGVQRLLVALIVDLSVVIPSGILQVFQPNVPPKSSIS